MNNGTLTLANVTVSQNLASHGGGLDLNDGLTTIVNSTIVSNTADIGSAIRNSVGADVIVVHRKGGAVSPGVPEQSILDRGKRVILSSEKGTSLPFGAATHIDSTS